MSRMKGGIEGIKETSPMFPRLNVKYAADRGGPKASPKNKMALYEQSNAPSQTLASGSPPQFPPLLRNNSQVSSLSGHVGSNQGIQYCNCGVSCHMAEKLHAYHPRTENLTKLMRDGHINSNSSVKNYEHVDASVTPPVSTQGKNSCCSISQNEEDEDKLARCRSSCSLISQNSFSKKVNLPRPMKLMSARYEKNQIDDHTEVNQTDLPEVGSAHPAAGFGDMTDESSTSSVKIRTPKPIKKSHSSLMEDFRSISADSLKILQGGNGPTKEKDAAFGDKINLRDACLEKPATSHVHKCPDVLEIGRNFFWGKRDGHKSEDKYRHYDALSKNIPDYAVGMKMTPDDVIGVIGEKQFWRARRTIINQQITFVQQVFELHRLIKVQKLIAGSTSLLIRDHHLLSKHSLKVSAPRKLQSDYVIEQPPSDAKLNNTKFEKPTPVECAGKTLLPLPGVNNMSKGPSVQLPNYGHHSGNYKLALPAPTNNTKSSHCYIYPAPENQWLVPFMSPSEGLVYKPIAGPCPPNAGFMGPVHEACNPISHTPGNKDIQDATHIPYIFPPSGPPVLNPSSISAFGHEQMSSPTKMQSRGTTESYQSTGVVNSAILHQSSSFMSSQISQVMSRQITANDNHISEDKDVQISTGSSSPNRMKGEALPLFPMAPTFWASSDQKKSQAVEENQPRIIKAIPHNPKSTTESAARIFRSIQEERKYL